MNRTRPDRTAVALCDTYNAATCPWVLRTDWQHHRQSQRARAAKRLLLCSGAYYRELEDGRLVTHTRMALTERRGA
jgi:hypothetical protein